MGLNKNLRTRPQKFFQVVERHTCEDREQESLELSKQNGCLIGVKEIQVGLDILE